MLSVLKQKDHCHNFHASDQMFSSTGDATLHGSVLFGAMSLGVMCFNYFKATKEAQNLAERRQYTGSCHCQAVTFFFRAPKHLTIWDCNCSVCFMKKNAHVVVPQSDFKLLTGQDSLSVYTFNTQVAKHFFCKRCGVQSFYVSVTYYVT